MVKHSTTSNSYIPGIDGLRAIAVLSVLLYHFEHTLIPGGFTGVDIFFVISGYVISKSLAASNSTYFPTYILGFYKRRILRIVPALLFLLIVTSIATSLFVPDAWLSEKNKWTALSAFFGISNIFLVSGADGYFSDRIPFNPFVHTWSLAVEEQFYLFFPLIFYIWLKARNGEKLPRTISFLLLPIIALASLALSAYETKVAHERAFYLLPSRFWELAVGAILFQLQSRHLFLSEPSTRSKWLLLSGAALLTVGFIFSDEAFFPFPWALFPVVGALLMIAGTTQVSGVPNGIQVFMESRALTYIGRISYSLYLWHWVVFSLFRWTVGLTKPLTAIVALLLTFILSSLSYHLLENSFRRNTFLGRQASWKIVTIGLGAVAASFLATALLFKYDDSIGIRLSVTSNSYDWSPYYSVSHKTDLTPIDATNSLGRGKQIFVIGDSHAGAYSNMVKLAAASLGAKATILSRSGCAIATLIDASMNTQACRNFEQDILDRMKVHSSAGDIVFLASLRMHRLSNQWGAFESAEVLSRSATLADIEERKLALTQASVFIEKLEAMGLHVLMDAPKPIFRAPPFRCSDWFNRSNPVCEPGFTVSKELLLRLREPTLVSLRELQKSHGIHVWDPFPILCGGAVCSAFNRGKPVFSDGDHLSGYGGRLLVPSFTNQIQEIWREDARAGRQFRDAAQTLQSG
jgi:peptidoglycan/LPS O-acetylase OafA/YrhL